jgi:Bacterial Ig domain
MIRAALGALVVTLALLGASPAAAYWTAGGTGTAFGAADTLDAGNSPTAAVSGSTVTVSWLQTVFHGLPLGGYSNGGYVVRRYPAGGGAAVTPGAACAGTINGGGATLSCAEASVPAGSWRYTVVPVLGSWTGAESLKSAAVLVGPNAPALAAATPQNPGAGQATGAIVLGWNAVAGATGYNVYRRSGSGSYDFTAPLNGATPIAATAYTDPGSALVAGTTYAYVVRAVTAGAESANSNELSATPIARLAPPPSAAAAPIAAGQISVSWPSVAGATGYNVYRRLASGTYDFSSPLNGATPVGAATFTDATAVDGTTYRYVVRSVLIGAGGVGLESLSASPESNAATSDAVAPSTVTIADPGSPLRGTITLSGTATDSGSGIASVRMQVAPAGSSSWTTACTATTSPYACSFDTTSVADGVYDLRAVAADAAGNSTTSTVVTNRRIDNTGPSVAVNDPGAYLRGTVTISAAASDPGAGITSVAIQRAPTGTATWTTICTDTTSAYSCSLNTTALTDGGYDLRAIATDAAGNTTTSASLANRTVDNTGPTGVDIQTTNAGTSAHPETGDTIAFTFSEAMSPASILAGWTGASTPVTVRFTNGNPDVVTIWNSANTLQTALGSFNSGKKYVTATMSFTGSTMLMSGATVVVTLGTPTTGTQTPHGNTALKWTVSAAATDLAGNPLTAGTITESGLGDEDF